MVDVAEESVFDPDSTVGKFVGNWVEMGVAVHDLGVLEDTRSSYSDQSVKAMVLVGSIGIAGRSLDRTGRYFGQSQDCWG